MSDHAFILTVIGTGFATTITVLTVLLPVMIRHQSQFEQLCARPPRARGDGPRN